MSSKRKKPPTGAAMAESFGYAENLKQLFESGRLLAVDIEKFPVATLITDKEGVVKQINQAFSTLFGYSAGELTGKHFSLLVHPEDRERMQKMHETFFQIMTETQNEWQAVCSTGITKHVLSSATLFTDRKQEICRASFILDISKVKDTEPPAKGPDPAWMQNLEVLELAESMVMHDVKKPIANIIGICNLLLNSAYDPLKAKNWLEILKSEANKSFKLLDTKSGFKRMELNTYQPEMTRFNITDTIRNILAPLNPVMREQSKKTAISINGRAWQENENLFIKADELFLEIMLSNLIINAIEASPKKGEVKIALLTENKKNLKVIINNKGAIPAEVQKSFFEKYTTFGKTTGLGLGTYTAKLIAKAHKGDISFTTSPTEGTSLQVFLPGIVDE